ncbi:O-acetyl-ADP-ribose deacetylase, partial [Ligilactobacillus salivarius]
MSETIENYIYCRVIFEENGKSYYYLTDDEEIKPLDLVVVPVGIDGREKIAQVIKVEKYTIHTVPYPLDKIKKNDKITLV